MTVALPLSVKVQVLVLFPPLEHAPDQMTSRSFVARSVIAFPMANDAEPVLPTATLIPVGVDVTRSPLRPVAVTVRVAVCPGGVTVSVAVRVTPPALAVIVTGVDAVTDAVLTVNVALKAPAGTVTLAGTVAALVSLLDSVTTAPPEGAALVSLAVPSEVLPPTTLAGLSAIPASEGAWVKAPGVKRRTEDQAPAVPAELMPRTRHQCRRPQRPAAPHEPATRRMAVAALPWTPSRLSSWTRSWVV